MIQGQDRARGILRIEDVTRREFVFGALGAALLIACGDDDEDGPATSVAGNNGFPIRIDGKFGLTEIPAPATRVVTAGLTPDADTLLALGLVPAGIARERNAPDGLHPWTKSKLGSQASELLDFSAGAPFEQILALHPDLIIGTTSYTLDKDHERLSQIAPVLSYVSGPNVDRWQDTTARIGQALGREADARQLLADVDSAIATVRQEHTEFDGKTFTFGPVLPDGSITTVNSLTDISASFLAQLGLELSPRVTELPGSGTPGRSAISPERLNLLEADVLILTYVSPQTQATLEENPLFQQLGAVRRGAYIAIPLPDALAMAFPSCLSIPYVLSRMTPLLSKALQA